MSDEAKHLARMGHSTFPQSAGSLNPRMLMAKRDTTRALEIAKAMKRFSGSVEDAEAFDEMRTELVQILTDIDARSGRRDPSKRKRATKAGKKAAKKATARRR